MFRKLRLHALALGLALATLTPTIGLARDHDRDFRHERHEERERARHFLRHDYVVPGYGYSYGYYDRWGYWHPYRTGYWR